MLLSLDISTSKIGYAIFDNKNLITANYIDLTKIEKDPFLKLDVAIAEIDKLVRVHKVNSARAEAALQKFTAGKSNAHTMNLLMAFNFAISYAIRNMNVDMSHVSFAEARKKTGIKFIKKSSSEEKKELIRQYCEKKYPQLIWPKKKTGKYKEYCYDISDAIIIGETCF